MTKTGLAPAIVAVVLLASSAARAQTSDSPQWLKDRQYSEGAGILTGDFELHPSIAGEAGYDSNWFLRSSANNINYANSAPNAPVVGALEFRITPALYLSTLSRQRRERAPGEQGPALAFRGGVNATYREFVGVSNSNSSGTDNISNQRNVSIGANGSLDILPERPVGAAVAVSYNRVIQPNVVTADPDQSFVYDTIAASAALKFRPGQGTLSWSVGYHISDTIFETSAGSPYDNLTQGGVMGGQWRFRPRTSLFYDLSVDYAQFQNPSQAAPVVLLSSTPVRTRIGINGLITDRFAAEAAVGWGASFFSAVSNFPQEPQYDSVIAHAELKWFLSASPGIEDATKVGLTLSSIAIGYDRNFQTSYLGDYAGTDKGYLKFNYLFAGRALVSLEGSATAMEYPDLYWATGSTYTLRHSAYTDAMIAAVLFGEYRFTNSFGLNLSLRYTQNVSNTQLAVAPTAPGAMPPAVGGFYDMAWNRFEAFIGLRWFL
jgi:putative beta-barrel porin BBP2